MRIGAILPHLYLFGGVRRYVELASAFASRGDEFIIYTPDGGKPRWTELDCRCASIEQARSVDHDVMITGSPEYIEELRGSRAGLRVFYIQIEGVAGEREIARMRDIALMANSRGIFDRISVKYGRKPIDGRGGINPSIFHPVFPTDRTDGPLRIMCYGRLSRPRKGTRFVISAAASMYRDGRDVELLLFDSLTPGSSDPRIGFDPGLPFRFYIDLPQERMAAMYSSADVFVSAEHRAGWSNTCAEAAACALPLVCTWSGTEDFAIDGKTAHVIGSRSSRSVRKALEKVYADREGAARMGLAGAEKILGFTWDRVCDTMAGEFAKLIDSGKGA